MELGIAVIGGSNQGAKGGMAVGPDIIKKGDGNIIMLSFLPTFAPCWYWARKIHLSSALMLCNAKSINNKSSMLQKFCLKMGSSPAVRQKCLTASSWSVPLPSSQNWRGPKLPISMAVRHFSSHLYIRVYRCVWGKGEENNSLMTNFSWSSHQG